MLQACCGIVGTADLFEHALTILMALPNSGALQLVTRSVVTWWTYLLPLTFPDVERMPTGGNLVNAQLCFGRHIHMDSMDSFQGAASYPNAALSTLLLT